MLVLCLYLALATVAAAADEGSYATPEEFFAAKVQPNLEFCRTCHVPGGLADVPDGNRFLLSRDAVEDYTRLHEAWEALGAGVETNRLLTKPSNTDPEAHTGGAPWPTGSAEYESMKTLLACWDDPEGCTALLAGAGGGTPSDLPPLLGDLQANGGRNYAAVHCEGKVDGEPLPMDPRELIAGDNLENRDYAVWYNDPFEICETGLLFENQAKQNAILAMRGQQPAYTAKPRPKTCGEWRTAVENGRKYVMSNPITGAVLTADSLYNLTAFLGYSIPNDPKDASELLAKVTQQRYGWPAHPYRNPFPMPGEDPNATDGGSIQLPIALVQVKDDEGKWTGKVGSTCFACHVGQIGRGEVVGNSAKRDGHPELYGGSPSGMFVSLNGSNTDSGLALWDVDRANSALGIGPSPNGFNANLNTPPYMANRTRGTNAADQEIVNVLLGRDLDTLDWRNPALQPELLGKLVPTVPLTGGDQDVPTWWWTHNKSRYLWVGFGSSGSSRNNFFPSSTNPHDGHWSKRREGDYQDLDLWLNAVEAPAWPHGSCSNPDGTPAAGDDPRCINRPLAEQGAILFHAKDLWANDDNPDIIRPPGGNGSCAGCHGAYSPRYIHQPGFLPDPGLAGMSGYTVPISIVGTDAAQSALFTGGADYLGESPQGPSFAGSITASSWFSYPDAREGYRFPEHKSPVEEALDDFRPSTTPGKCMLGTKGGYTAQPLHGVWATGPYLHNGSVPTVWDLLAPAGRPDVWLRQQVPASEASPGLGDRGFDTDMARAYDYEKLGWKYERVTCDARKDAATQLSCATKDLLPSPLDTLLTPLKAVADYVSPPYLAGPGEGEVDARAVYNTHAYSKGNQGHEFPKVLTDAERRALIEYLKTL